VVKPNVIEVQLVDTKDEPTTPGDQNHRDGMDEDRSDPRPFTLALPWAAQSFSAVKGVLHTPEPSPILKSELRDGLLTAIAKARGWVNDLLGNRVTSFAEIAIREGRPNDTSACWRRSPSSHADHRGPHRRHRACRSHHCRLAKALPDSWTEQERQFGLTRA